MTLKVAPVIVMPSGCYPECRCAEYRYSDSHYAVSVILNVVMLTAVILIAMMQCRFLNAIK
jgi:hypothetical protein